MKKRILIYIFLLLLVIMGALKGVEQFNQLDVPAKHNINGLIEVDFDYSMGVSDYASYRKLFIKDGSRKNFNFLRDLYNKNKPSQKQISDTPIIPKIIHQVWVGGSEIPALFRYYQKTCQDLHPNWEYKLWTDSEIENYDFPSKDLYEATRNYAEKSDILRHQLLKDFGGVYIDIDIKCTKALDPLHHLYDAYFGLEFPSEWGKPMINSAIMGSKPEHKIVTSILKKIRSHWQQYDSDFDEGKISLDDRVVHRIGIERSMAPVIDVVLEQTELNDNVIVLPATYFYPLIRLTGEKLYDPLYIRVARDIFDFTIKLADPFVSESARAWLYDHYRPKHPFFIHLRKESLAIHDYFRKNSTLVPITFKDGFGLYDLQRKNYYKKLDKADLVKFSVFQGFYENNNPYSKLGFNKKSKINQNIHFINLDGDLSVDELANINSWSQVNKDSTIIIWNRKEIKEQFAEVLEKASKIKNKDDSEFYIALNVLHKVGGLYINKKQLEARTGVFELNNKYDLYTGLLPLSQKHQSLSIDTNFFASKAGHKILTKILSAMDAVAEPDINMLVKYNLYKYQGIGGKNIILPPIYFHPIDHETDKTTIIDRFHSWFFGYERAFSQVNEFDSMAVNEE